MDPFRLVLISLAGGMNQHQQRSSSTCAKRIQTHHRLHANDVCRMMEAPTEGRRPAHSAIAAFLSRHHHHRPARARVPLEDVQRLAGHADPRTTRLYDRRDKKITRNIVERISI